MRSKLLLRFRIMRVYFALLVETFPPRPWILHRWAQGDKARLPRQDLHTVVDRFRGQWFGQQEWHYLRAEVRRRALRGIVTSFALSDIKSDPIMNYQDHYAEIKSESAFACLFPPSLD